MIFPIIIHRDPLKTQLLKNIFSIVFKTIYFFILKLLFKQYTIGVGKCQYPKH